MFGLTADQYLMFLQVHVKHLKTMGTEQQKKYSLSNVKNVKWDKREGCIKVFYQDSWWHYSKDHKWY